MEKISDERLKELLFFSKQLPFRVSSNEFERAIQELIELRAKYDELLALTTTWPKTSR